MHLSYNPFKKGELPRFDCRVIARCEDSNYYVLLNVQYLRMHTIS
jgi:hypothetical protein